MTAWASTLAAVLLASPVAADTVDHSRLFTIADPAIHESSGLADHGSVVFTVNDSGSDPVLYALDPRTGRTAGATPYGSEEVQDTEALAPGRGKRVWVGDIGDNLGGRPSVSVYDVRPGRAGGRRFELAYPDGPRDAEALLAHPVTGRLFVVSKRVFGGVVYAAPRELDPRRPNRLTRFAQVSGLVTGGEFLPDGKHVVLRSYGTAAVYTFPGFDLRGTVALPDQEQGEALSVGPDGRVLLSSEGVRSDVLRIKLPEALTEPAAATPRPSSARPTAGPSTDTDAASAAESWEQTEGRVIWVVAGIALLAALGWRLRRLWRYDRRH